MNIGKLVKNISKEIIPYVKIDTDSKKVYLKQNFLFTNFAQAYYTLRGYETQTYVASEDFDSKL